VKRTLTNDERLARARAIVALSDASTQATLTIDLSAIAANWKKLASLTGNAECGAVVKADAYGTGIEFVVPVLERAGCRTFFVAHVSEGKRVRDRLRNKSARIFVLNGILPKRETVESMLIHRLIPVIGSLPEWRFWRDIPETNGFPVALHVDTGMNRLGLDARDIPALAQDESFRKALSLLIGHFVSSEVAGDPLNARQIAAFEAARKAFPQVPASLANSSGIFLPARPHYALARAGYGLYGGNPTPDHPNPMRPVVTLEAPIIQLRDIEAGATVGYNGRWTAKRPTRLAAIGLGYADGLMRSANGVDAKPDGGFAILAGARCPFVGRVSMDLTVIDVTDAPGGAAVAGALMEILGPNIGVDDLAARAGTIGYEVLTNLGRRYNRVYIGD
jgi:alanine racemase